MTLSKTVKKMRNERNKEKEETVNPEMPRPDVPRDIEEQKLSHSGLVDDSKSIDKQVDDSKINLKTTAEPKNSMPIYIVIAILVTVIPFVTWRYFTK